MLTNHEGTQRASVVILGAGGFLGMAAIDAAIDAAVDAGLSAIGVVRQPDGAQRVESRGGVAVIGDAEHPESWLAQAANAVAVIDLIQPKIPRRLGSRALAQIVSQRATTTRSIVDALKSIPAGRRPLYVSVSGVAELVPDQRGLISHESTRTSQPAGSARIGPCCSRRRPRLGSRRRVRPCGNSPRSRQVVCRTHSSRAREGTLSDLRKRREPRGARTCR